MNWESFWQTIGNLGNISLVIIAVAALLYYFGRLIGDVKVEKYEKTDFYIEGLFFSLIYITLPFIVILLLTEYVNLYLPFWPSVFLQIFILGCLWLSAISNEYLRKHGGLSRFRRLTREKIEELREKYSLVAFSEDKIKNSLKKDFTELYSLVFHDIPIKYFGNKNTLFLFSLIVIWSFYSNISLETLLLPSSLFLAIITFVNFTFLALAHGYVNAYYPPARIILENGNEITGKILKIGKFVCVLKEKEEKKLFINEDKIVYVEESLFKEKVE
jgi:hypothetical protein